MAADVTVRIESALFKAHPNLREENKAKRIVRAFKLIFHKHALSLSLFLLL